MAEFLVRPRTLVSRAMREERQGHRGAVFWLTGLSGAGKSTLAHRVEQQLFALGMNIVVLDGDIIRHGLCAGLGFSPEDRAENIRRIAELAHVLVERGHVCLCAFITPLAAHRALARSIVGADYHEIYIACPVEECERRDVKGFYRLAREGRIANYTGISAPYEPPQAPGLRIDTDRYTEEQCAAQLKIFILERIRLGE